MRPADVTGANFHGDVLLSGAFNPLHAGHLQMAEVAERIVGRPVWFELSIRNADKPATGADQIRERLKMADPNAGTPAAGQLTIYPHGLILSNLATFEEKSQIFRDSWFTVGVDTVVRIADPKFYCASTVRRDRAVARIAAAGCRFLVFGRLVEGRFLELADVRLPAGLREICRPVSRSEFRNDLSSTRLRNHR